MRQIFINSNGESLGNRPSPFWRELQTPWLEIMTFRDAWLSEKKLNLRWYLLKPFNWRRHQNQNYKHLGMECKSESKINKVRKITQGSDKIERPNTYKSVGKTATFRQRQGPIYRQEQQTLLKLSKSFRYRRWKVEITKKILEKGQWKISLIDTNARNCKKFSYCNQYAWKGHPTLLEVWHCFQM